jgi:hypothetical protein
MTDDELRALVRDAIARHLGPRAETLGDGHGQETRGQAVRADEVRLAPAVARSRDSRPDPPWRAHPSFGKFLVMRGDEDGGACLIEPSVECNHCGFCQSYGH